MLLIVAHHYVVNSGIIDTMYENPLSANSIFLFLFGAWGKTGINCFVVITGYFMCKSKITLEKYTKLILEILFYNLVLSFLFLLTGYGTWSDIVNALFIVKRINSGNFTACFLIFYLLIPFLNIFLENINKRQHQFILTVLMFLYVFLGTAPTFNVVMNYVSWFCFLYLVAAYIRFYPHDKGKWSLCLATLILVACCSVIVCLALGKIYNKEMAYRFVSDSNTFIAFAIAICSFMLFKNLKIRHSNFINAIGGSTFGVLCIHANSNTMREWLWQTVFDVKGHFSLPTIQLILYSIGCVILTFVCCTVLDLLRKKYIEQPVMNRMVLNSHFRQLDAFFEFIVNTKF